MWKLCRKGTLLGSLLEIDAPILGEVWRVPHQGRGAVRSKEQWRKTSKKQEAAEINFYALTLTSCTAQHCTEGTGKTSEGETRKVGREMLD